MSQEWEGAGEPQDYFAYLLRLWREKGGETTRWRASLQDPHSGERLGFAHLEDLFGFLRRETGDAPERVAGGLGHEGKGADAGNGS
jgi:hypothetical protein